MRHLKGLTNKGCLWNEKAKLKKRKVGTNNDEKESRDQPERETLGWQGWLRVLGQEQEGVQWRPPRAPQAISCSPPRAPCLGEMRTVWNLGFLGFLKDWNGQPADLQNTKIYLQYCSNLDRGDGGLGRANPQLSTSPSELRSVLPWDPEGDPRLRCITLFLCSYQSTAFCCCMIGKQAGAVEVWL